MSDSIARRDSTAPAVADAAPDWLAEELGAAYNEAVKENLEGEGRALPVIKIMHGNELYKMPDGNTAQTFTGVILWKHHVRSYWKGKKRSSEGERKPPTCASIDAKNGSLTHNEQGEFGECKTCIHSVLNRMEDGSTRASDCAEKVRMLVLIGDDSILPYVLIASTKSMSAIRDYMITLAARRIPYFTIRTQFRLRHNQRGEQQWSEVELINEGPILREQFSKIQHLRSTIEERAKAHGIEDISREMTQSEAPDAGQGTASESTPAAEEF